MNGPERTASVPRKLLLTVAYNQLRLLESCGAEPDRALLQLLALLGYRPDHDTEKPKAQREKT